MSKCGDECKCSLNKPNIKDLWDDAYRGYNNAPIREICGEGAAKILFQFVQLDRVIMIFLICLLSMMAFKVIKPEWGIFVGVYIARVFLWIISYLIVRGGEQ